jgi:glycosyltransferase involved in cell wall biosynthesis
METKRPDISIIVPCYTYGRFLPETLRSLEEQTFADWECILVANGSDDLTLQVIREHVGRDPRFREVVVTNRGPAAARNEGLRSSTGRLIQFLDADDLLEPRKLESQRMFLDEHPEVDLVYGEVCYFTHGEPDRLRSSLHLPEQEWMPGTSGKGPVLVNALIRYNIMTVHAPLFRRELLVKVEGMDESLSGFEDWDLWLRMALAGAMFRFLPAAGTRSLVRTHPESLNQDRHTMRRYLLRVWEKALGSGHLTIRQRLFVWSRMEEEFGAMVAAGRTRQAYLNSRTRFTLWIGFPFIYPMMKAIRFVRNHSIQH